MIIDAINHCLAYAGMKGWKKTYWAIDIHGTILEIPRKVTTSFRDKVTSES